MSPANAMSPSNCNTSPHLTGLVGQPNIQPHLSFYISRTNGTFVPLVPADEIPFNVRLQGVPPVLNQDQVFGLQYIATLPFTGATFKIEEDRMVSLPTIQPPPAAVVPIQAHATIQPQAAPIVPMQPPPAAVVPIQPQSAAHNRSNSGPDVQNARHSDIVVLRPRSSHNTPIQVVDPPRSMSAVHETTTTWRKPPTPDAQTVIDAIVRTKSGEEAAAKLEYVAKRPLPPSGKEPAQEKKEYCTHWIRHGECDYTQQGCLYKHEMPDKATLFKIGFRSTPKWWLDKNRPRLIQGAKAADGARATVGPLVKPAVWLKAKKTESTDLSSSTSEVSDSESSEEEWMFKGQASKAKAVIKKTVPTRQTPPPPPAKHQSIVAESSERKKSTTDNLIDFEPLVPTPASTSTLSTASCSSCDSDNIVLTKPMAVPTSFSTAPHETKKFKRKVFVPGGEDREAHIAEAKAKAARKRASLAAKKAKVPVPAAAEVQVQKTGLMASKHAPSGAEEPQVVRVKKAHRHRRAESVQA